MHEPTRRFDADQDRLPHHYPADTRVPFDVAMELNPSVVNHVHWRRQHVARLATPGIAPGPPIPRRRRVEPVTVVAWLVILALAVLFCLLLDNLPKIAVA